MKQVQIHKLLNRSASGASHVEEDRERAYALAVQREQDAENKQEERALAKDFENALEDRGIVAATETLGGLMEAAIDIFAPSDKPTLSF